MHCFGKPFFCIKLHIFNKNLKAELVDSSKPGKIIVKSTPTEPHVENNMVLCLYDILIYSCLTLNSLCSFNNSLSIMHAFIYIYLQETGNLSLCQSHAAVIC